MLGLWEKEQVFGKEVETAISIGVTWGHWAFTGGQQERGLEGLLGMAGRYFRISIRYTLFA